MALRVRLKRLAFGLLVVVAGAYIGVTAILFFTQRSLLYHPETRFMPPSAFGLADVRDLKLATPDGASLVAWYQPAAPGRPTLLFFHGNAGALYHRRDRLQAFAAAGIGVFMLSYRGFAGSSGSPSQAALVADAELAYDWLRAENVDPGRIVIAGESLGAGVAVQLAARREAAALILEAPFASAIAMGKLLFPFLPVELLLLDPFDSLAAIGAVAAPVFILHGDADKVIPVGQGRQLFAAARSPKRIEILKGRGHALGSFDVYAMEIDFIDEVLAKAGGGARLPSKKTGAP